MALNCVSLAETNDKTVESDEQDLTAMYVQTGLALHSSKNKFTVRNFRIKVKRYAMGNYAISHFSDDFSARPSSRDTVNAYQVAEQTL